MPPSSEHKQQHMKESYPEELQVEEFEEFGDTIEDQLKGGQPQTKEYKFSVIDEIGRGSSYTSSLVETIKGTKLTSNLDSGEKKYNL